jgi:hypothetical protein
MRSGVAIKREGFLGNRLMNIFKELVLEQKEENGQRDKIEIFPDSWENGSGLQEIHIEAPGGLGKPG